MGLPSLIMHPHFGCSLSQEQSVNSKGIWLAPVIALRISRAASSRISIDACSLYQAAWGVQIRFGASFRGPWLKLWGKQKKVREISEQTPLQLLDEMPSQGQQRYTLPMDLSQLRAKFQGWNGADLSSTGTCQILHPCLDMHPEGTSELCKPRAKWGGVANIFITSPSWSAGCSRDCVDRIAPCGPVKDRIGSWVSYVYALFVSVFKI